MSAIEAIHAHLGAATSAPDDVAWWHAARARVLLVALEQVTAEARRGLEALEREMVRKGGALVLTEEKPRGGR